MNTSPAIWIVSDLVDRTGLLKSPVLLDGIRDALEWRGWMIELTCNLNPQLRMTRNRVIIDRDPAIGRDELAALGEHQRVDFQRARFNAVRTGK